MDRRDVSKALIGIAGGSALLLAKQAEAQSCTAPCYPQTAAELAAGVTPSNTSYAPGNLLRYGANNTGSTPNSNTSALQNAIKCNTAVYAPTGTYIFTSGATTTKSSITITGDNRGTTGTIFELRSSTTDDAVITFGAFVEFITIEKIQFSLSGTLAQYCLNFPQGVGDSVIDDCLFLGNCSGSSNTGSVGIAMTASTKQGVRPYDGDIDIRDCWIADLYVGVALAGATTTVRITNCEFAGAPTPGNSYGVDMNSGCAGVVIQGCTFTQWGIGVLSAGGYLRQIGNYFETNTQADWYWTKGASVLYNSSIVDINPGKANFCSYPTGGGCVVIGPTYVQHS
jgi:hypothetical protein